MTYVIIDKIGAFIWTYLFFPSLILLSLRLSIGCKWLHFRKFRMVMKNTIGKAFTKADSKDAGPSPFQAASTALGSTVGTGNIVGTAQAICMGGPGALFWLWISALLAMIVKYAEILLAIYYRKNKRGFGPMDYIEHGLRSKRLAAFYAFMALLSSLAMGNIAQASSISDAVVNMVNYRLPLSVHNLKTLRICIGFVLAGLTLLLSGGAKKTGKISAMIVPLMVISFILLSTGVIAVNHKSFPLVLRTVFVEAFRPGSICAGISGISTSRCIQWGLRRSAFSNEAGLGTSAIAHASACAESPAQQGLWGIFEVFTDTVLICSCTAFCILCSGIDIPWGTMPGSGLFLDALSSIYGKAFSSFMLAAFICLFAYTSILGWAMYGSKCCEYIFGEKAAGSYPLIFSFVLIAGSILPLEYIWQLSDLINAMMSIPNMLALLCLCPIVIRLSPDCFS